jgi:hypothetical protein
MMASIAAGLVPTASTISGAAAASAAASAAKPGHIIPIDPVATNDTMINSMFQKMEQSLTSPAKHAFVSVISQSCSWCAKLYDQVKQHKAKLHAQNKNADQEWPHMFVTMDALGAYKGHDQYALMVKSKIQQGQGVPQTFVLTKSSQPVVGPIVGFMPVDQLEQQALKLLQGK